MKAKYILRSITIAVILSFATASCSDWLAVNMEDGIMENELFKTNEGYLASLNGIYSKMNETYGSTLSMEIIDAMAQYYNIAKNSNHRLYPYANYQFNESTFENMSGELWTNLYGLIANLNTLLEHCDESGTALKAHYYPYVKGEALALRAMIHFDLLRIYGPIYNKTTESTICISYQETTSKNIQPLLSAQEVITRIIRDLNAASELLKEDKIRTDGVMNSDSENPNETSDFRYRQFRLNYYAVRGLLARAHQWTGNRKEAYNLAHEIITENNDKKIFPWTLKSAVQTSNPDRLFSTEVMFSLYNLKRVNLFDSYFKRSASISNSLTFTGESMDDGNKESKLNYFYSDLNDLRRADNMWSLETMEESNESGTTTQKALCFSKYADISTNKTFRYMIPLIRMSEFYLIAAESTDDLTEAIGYVNEIRKNRNCVDIELTASDTEETILNYITKEFAREVIGEGQLYFFYKAHSMGTIMSGTDFGMWYDGTYNMDLNNYVWPLPKVEKDKRTTTSK